MNKLQALKKVINEQQRLQKRRDNILTKVGKYDHLDEMLNATIIEITQDRMSLEEVEAFFEREDIIELKK